MGQGHEAARPHVEVDGSGKANRLVKARLRRSLGSVPAQRGASASALSLVENGHQHHRLDAPLRARAANLAPRPLLLALQLSRVGRTQLLGGTFRVADV